MKTVPWISIAALAGVLTFALSIAPLGSTPARAATVVRVDEPPPDPAECPFCGGNPELHRTRVRALLRMSAQIFELAMP